MILSEWCRYANNDISAALNDGNSENSRTLFPFLDEINSRYLKIKRNLSIYMNDLQNMLDVGRCKWESIKKKYDAIVHDNIVK